MPPPPRTSRTSSHRSSSSRRRRSTKRPWWRRHSRRPTRAPELIVDVVRPEPHLIWTLLGAGSIVFTSVLMIYYPLTPMPWIGVGTAVAWAILGGLTRTMTPPRVHAVAVPAVFLLILLPLERLLGGHSIEYAVSDPILHAIALVWMFPLFFRRRWEVLASALVWLLVAEFYLAINLPGQSVIHTPVYTNDQGFAELVYRGGWETRLLMLFALAALVTLVVDLRNDRKRMRGRVFLQFFSYGGLAVSIVSLTVALIRPDWIPVDTTPLIMGGFGVSLAGRQRRILEDSTRHPARHSTPLAGYLEEAWLAVQSVLGSLRPDPGITPPTPRSPRLDAASDRLYNPYSNEQPRWSPVVLHMHTNRWEGRFSKQAMVDHYYRIGATSVILTDHNRITTVKHPFQTIPAYEHGWGLHHHHVLVLNARQRLRESHAFGSNLKQLAGTIARLRHVSDFLILAHPKHRNAWSSDDVRKLDYDALEVFNKSADSTRRWDEALSADRLVWATAGDDCHDLRSRHQTGKRFLLVDLGDKTPPSGTPADPDAVLDCLRTGRFLSVHIESREVTRSLVDLRCPLPESFTWENGRLRVRFTAPVDHIRVYGAFRTTKGDLLREQEVVITPNPNETYVRIRYEHAQTTVILNPVVRLAEDSPQPGEQ